jgi:hypothetical protein
MQLLTPSVEHEQDCKKAKAKHAFWIFGEERNGRKVVATGEAGWALNVKMAGIAFLGADGVCS